jgi:hypothetical protein
MTRQNKRMSEHGRSPKAMRDLTTDLDANYNLDEVARKLGLAQLLSRT